MDELFLSYINYQDWRRRYFNVLTELSDKKVLLLFSGGEDSSLAADLMTRASQDFDFNFEAHAGIFPNHRYTIQEMERLGQYWQKRGIQIHWNEICRDESQLENSKNPCKECQKVNKFMLNSLLKERIGDWENLVLVPAYSLWDLVSYLIEYILNNVVCSSDINNDESRKIRTLVTAQRFYPLLTMKEGYRIFRPVITFNSYDIQRYLITNKIPTLSIPCKFQRFSAKRTLMGYYKNALMSFDYERVLQFVESLPEFPDICSYGEMKKEHYLSKIF